LFSSPLAIRKINDQLIQLERGFVDPHGLPGRPEFKYGHNNKYNSRIAL